MSKLPGKMTRKQHWVPQFYLRHFANSSGQLHAYNRGNGVFYRTKVGNVCSKRDLYEVRYSDIGADSDDKYMRRTSSRQSCLRMKARFPFLTRGFWNPARTRRSKATPFDRDGRQSANWSSNLIVRHPVAMQGDKRKAREEPSLLQVDGVLTEEDQALLDCSG